MPSDDDAGLQRIGGSSASSRGARPTEDADPGATMTIEQRYELETTLAQLELEDERFGISIGPEDRYVLRKLLGRGSMGTVYLAEDIELEREVAIKVVSRHIEHERLVLDLRREARALAAIDHPNVLKIFDIGSEHGEHFIAMEYVAGQTLRAWQRDRPADQLIDAYVHVGRGLAEVHRCGLVHRDFKPDNALVDQHDGRTRVRVGDFGLAGYGPHSRAATSPGAVGRGILGTLPYMAPEQLRGERAEPRSDQHQFCVSLWEALAGERPFGAAGRLLAASTAVPPRPSAIPRWLHPVLRRGLAFEPRERYATMDDLLGAITRARLWQRTRTGLVAGGLVAGVIAVVRAMQPDPCELEAGRMQAIWNDEARAEIEAAFASHDSTKAQTMSGYLVDHLDQAAALWSERVIDTCEARVHATVEQRAELEHRSECLDRWAQRMKSRVEWLRAPEDDRMAHAFELVAPLTHAGDSCTLPPVLIDGEVDAAIEKAERAELLRDLDGAKALAHEAVELARSANPCPITGPQDEPRSPEMAAALYRLGHVLSERRESDAALDALEQAHQHAHACQDDHRDAEANIHAAKVLTSDLEDVDAAARVLHDAWVALGRVGEPPVSLRRYDERMAAGTLAERKGELEAARRLAEAGRVALGDDLADPVLAAKLDINEGVAWAGEGEYERAAEAYDRAAQRVARALGLRHPQARFHGAQRDLNLGLLAQARGELETMRRYFGRAIAAGESPVVAKALTAWSQSEYEAVAALLAFLSGNHHLSPFTLATAETTAGQILAWRGDARSTALLERACTRWTKLDKDDELARCEVALGGALVNEGRLDDARRVLMRLRNRDVSSDDALREAIEELDQSLSSEAPNPPIERRAIGEAR